MSDIVERLRSKESIGLTICVEAADEIERLRTKINELELELDQCGYEYKEMIERMSMD
jgi:hypothetical protein